VPTTAGPWKLVQSMGNMLVGDDGTDIAKVTPEPGKADDVTLIGMAPELLEIVNGLLDDDPEIVQKSRQRAQQIVNKLKR
jgi:hypothetical protein